MKKIILLIAVSLFICTVKAQNIECAGKTISIPLTGYKAGSIQWQFSTNKNEWTDLSGKTTSTLQYTLTQTGYFRARIKYGQCDYYSDTTFINVYPIPTTANAGATILIKTTDTITSLSANKPENGKGKWTIISGLGGSFDNDTIPNAKFTGRFNSDYILRWTISTECKSVYSDVNVGFHFEFLPPSNFSVNSISENKIELNWTDNCKFEKGFKLERSINDSVFIEIAVLDSNINKYVDSSINSKSSYSYRLRAFTDSRISNYSQICKTSWKVSELSFLRSLTGHIGPVWAVAISPDGQYVASGSGIGEGAVKLWKSIDGSLIRTFTNLEDVRCVQFSPDCSMLAIASTNTVKLYSVSDGSIIKTLYGEGGLSTVTCSFSSDGQIIVDGSASRKVHIWRISNGQLIRSLSGHTGTVWSVAISPDNSEIASGGGGMSSGSDDTYLRLWNTNDGSQKDSINNNTILIWNVVYSFDGNYLVTTTNNNICNIWNKNKTIKYSFSGDEISFKPNTNWLSVVDNSNVKFFNIDKGITSLSFPSGQGGIESLSFGSNNILVTGSYDKSVKLWSVNFKWTKD